MKIQKTYKIRSGNNYSNRFNLPLPNRVLYRPTEMVAKLTLNESMIYRNDNDGWMKLCGFSRGHHHDNSFRFVWRCWDGNLQIAAYFYSDKKRDDWRLASWPIRSIPFGCEIYLRAWILSNRIYFELVSVCHKNTGFVLGIDNPLPSFGYLLTPHFENPKAPQTGAPHDIYLPLEITIR
jgi:hypothetical protein